MVFPRLNQAVVEAGLARPETVALAQEPRQARARACTAAMVARAYQSPTLATTATVSAVVDQVVCQARRLIVVAVTAQRAG